MLTAQEILDKYKFTDGGIEVFPRQESALTPTQRTKLFWHYEQVVQLKEARATLARLESLKEKITSE